MMKDKKKTLNIIQHLSESLEHLPFSIKARTGLHEADKAEQLEFLFEASTFCSQISVHGRTLQQLYSGVVDWDFVGMLRQRVLQQHIPCKII